MNLSRTGIFLVACITAALLFTPVSAADSLPLGAEDALTGELVGESVCGYLLGTNDLSLDEVSDAAYVYVTWDGKPKTVTDMTGRSITLYRPVERIITNNPDNTRLVIAYGDGDLLVGSDECTVDSGCVCPMTDDSELICEECWEAVTSGGLNNLALTNDRFTPNHEQMVSLSPDLIFLWMSWEDQADDMEERVGAPVFVAGPDFTYESVTDHARAMGEALSKEDEADELIAFMDSKVTMITDITDTIPDDEKVRVYFAPRGAKNGFYDAKEGRDFTRTVNTYYPLEMAGGINVAEECADGDVNVALEQIIAWNPDVILVSCSTPNDAGVDFILEAPELQSIQAIQEGRVYNVFYPHCRGRPHDKNLLNVVYMAKILYPDKFADIHMDTEGNEIMAEFLGVDGVYSEYADYLKFPNDQQI